MQFERLPDEGVPSAGVTRVGDVANTTAPEPVSSVSAVASWADVNDPSTAAFPTEVTCPVKLAFVVTFPAVSPAAVPVRFVATPDVGVPSAPLNNTGAPALPLFTASAVAIPVPSPETPVLIGSPVQFVSVPEVGVPSSGVVSEGDVALTPLPVPVVVIASSAVAPLFTATILLPFPERSGNLPNPASIRSSSALSDAASPSEPVVG